MRHPVGTVVTALAVSLLVGCSGSSDNDSADDGARSRNGASAGVATTVVDPAYAAIEAALTGPGGLTICDRRAGPGDSSGSYDQRVFAVGRGSCSSAPAEGAGGSVVVDAYDSPTVRDAAAPGDFGVRLVAWAYQQFVISVSVDSSPEVVAGVETAMSSLRGAYRTYDRRTS